MAHDPLSLYWHKALATPFGIGLTAPDAEGLVRLKHALYHARRTDPQAERLASVTVRTSPARPTTDIWLIPRRFGPASPVVA